MDQTVINHFGSQLDTLFEFYWRCYMIAREHEAETGCEIEGLDKLNEEVLAYLNNETPEHPNSSREPPAKDISTGSAFSCTSNQSEGSTLSPETSSFYRSDNDGELVEVEDNCVELSSDSENPMSDLEIEEDIVGNGFEVKATPAKDDEQSIKVQVKHDSQRVEDLSLKSEVNLESVSDHEGSAEQSTAQQPTLDPWVNGQKQDSSIQNSVGDRGKEFLKPGFGMEFESILNKPICKFNSQKSVKEVYQQPTKQTFC